MPETKARRLAIALDEFISSSPDVEAAAVVSFDGLPMASALPDTMEEDRVGAMSAALLSLGEQAAMGLGRGQLNQVFVEGEYGYVFLMSARDQAVLAAVARQSAKIGFMLFEMRRAAERIGDVLLSTDGREPDAAFEEPAHQEPAHPEPEDRQPAYEEPVHHEPSHEEAPAHEPPSHEPYDEPAHQGPARWEPAHEEPAHQEPAHQEPAPWSSGIPEEHDLSASPPTPDQSPEEPGPEDFPYRRDADHTAAPWH